MATGQFVTGVHSIYQGAFRGFSFDGKHSSTYKIVRTSNSDRYSQKLTPNMSDKTAEVPGGDGTYYFSTNYTNSTIEVNFAFDSLTDELIVKMKQWLSGKEVKELVFDESPYMAYDAKVTGLPSLSFLAFGDDANRVYKGTGSVTFTLYYPFAHSRVYNSILGLTLANILTIWGLEDTEGKTNSLRFGVSYTECLLGSNLPTTYAGSGKYYNYGTAEAPFIVTNFTAGGGAQVKTYTAAGVETNEVTFEGVSALKWDTHTGLITTSEGIRYPITSGDPRLVIPPNGGYVDLSSLSSVTMSYKYWYC